VPPRRPSPFDESTLLDGVEGCPRSANLAGQLELEMTARILKARISILEALKRRPQQPKPCAGQPNSELRGALLSLNYAARSSRLLRQRRRSLP